MMKSEDDLAARIAANLEAALVMSEQARDVMAELATLVGTASSSRGEVTVSVDHLGIVCDLALSDDATALGAARLGPLVLEVTQDAITNLRELGAPIQARLVADPGVIAHQTDIFDSLQRLRESVLDSATTEPGAHS